MSHTPGPWHWESDPVKGDPLGRSRYRVTTVGKTITQVYHSSGDANAEADARLIAAAPDLLEALHKINEWACFASEEDINARLLALQQIGLHARAAIAKATGGKE